MSAQSNTHFPLAGIAEDGYSNAEEATATCFCGAVQIAFPTHGPGLVNTFVCHCWDCRKVTASMFASNFTVSDAHLKYNRGRDNLKTYAQSKTIGSGATMTNYFCDTCGTLMNRVSGAFPGFNFLRIGTVDDFNLHQTILRPQVEQFIDERVNWLKPIEGVPQTEGLAKF